MKRYNPYLTREAFVWYAGILGFFALAVTLYAPHAF